MVFLTCTISQLEYEMIKICIYCIAIKASQKNVFFLSPKESQNRSLKLLADLNEGRRMLSWAFPWGGFQEHFCRAFPLMLELVSLTFQGHCNHRDVLGEGTPLVLGVSRVVGVGCWVLSHCFVLDILPEYYFSFGAKMRCKSTLEILFQCFAVVWCCFVVLFFLPPLQLLCGQP